MIMGDLEDLEGGREMLLVEASGRQGFRAGLRGIGGGGTPSVSFATVIVMAGPQKDVPAGMHRIEIGHMGMDVEEDHNVVTVSNMRGGGNVTIQVPSNASLELKAMSGGHIDVTGVNGEIEVNNLNGPINLMNVSGSVVAHSLNGAVTATLDKVSPGKPMSFTSLNGKIDVTLPADTKARVRLKTDHGSVYSDFDVKMEPDASKPVVEDAQGKGGKYKIKIDRGVYGSLNGGGPEYRFETMNGNILIHKK